MRIKSIDILEEKYNQCDITTLNENFYIKVNNEAVLVHNSPSIVAGKDPESGKFFVATKSAFTQNPKLMFSSEDINSAYSGDLAEKMQACLDYLPAVVGDKIVQGDLLFTESNKKSESIEGNSYITFRANTLTFAVPAGSDLSKKIDKAKMGIVFHALYEGDTVANMKINWEIKKTMFKESANVWWNTSTYEDLSGNVFFTKSESDTYLKLVDRIKTFKTDKFVLDFLSENQVIIKAYNNKRISSDQSFSNISNVVSGLIEYVAGRLKVEVDKVKTEKTKAIKQKQLDDMIDTLTTKKNELMSVYTLFNLFVEAKMMIINKLEDLRDTKFFIETPDGYKVTKSEGFVVADRMSNYVIKLVDRTEFSRNNFLMSKNRNR